MAALCPAEGGHHRRLHGVDGGVALLLDGVLVGGAQIRFADLEHGGFHVAVLGRLEVAGLLGGLLGETDDRLDDRLEMLVAEHHGAEHDLLVELLGLGLDHQDGVLGAGDDEVEGRGFEVGDQRVEAVLAVGVADAGGADRAHEGHARQGQGGGSRDHREDVGIVLEVMGQDGDDDLGVVAPALDEEGADRAVDEAGDQGLLLGRAALALEVPAGNAAGGVGTLLVVHGQRQEVDSGLGLLARHDGGEHRGLAVGRHHGTVGLAGDLARLEDELAVAPHQLFALDIEHMSHLPAVGRTRRRQGQDGGSVLMDAPAILSPAHAPSSRPGLRVAGPIPAARTVKTRPRAGPGTA
ncbi:hypothetical protein CFIICLFH_3064 [Methylobacterium goesingense]|nr:hypothetical protein CFIICLFH_3064 [Methylobacterium goesingense]